MGQLRSSSPFFRAGPPAQVGNADREIMNFLVSRVEGEILDLGGGLGAYAHALKALGHSVTLAEKNSHCLDSVRKLNIPVLDMNVTDLKQLEKCFDTVMVIEVLEHVENPREFLKSIMACARKKVLLTVPSNDGFEELFQKGLTYNHIAVEDHLQQFTRRDVADLLNEMGCKYDIRLGSHLFPHGIIPLLAESLGRRFLGKVALFPLWLFNKLGWLPQLFPSRIFVEAYPPAD